MNIAIKTALASMVFLAGSASVVHAAGAGQGTVTFKGAIIEAACSIDPESVDQTIGLGQVAKSALTGGHCNASRFLHQTGGLQRNQPDR